MSDHEAEAEADTAQEVPDESVAPAPEAAADAEVAAEASDSSPKKKRKKKKASAETSAEPKAKAPAPLPGEGTPEGEKLREANVAFESGNYARVRELGQELERAQDPAVADAARNLVRRVSVDPVQVAFLGTCAIALMVITWIYILEPHSH